MSLDTAMGRVTKENISYVLTAGALAVLHRRKRIPRWPGLRAFCTTEPELQVLIYTLYGYNFIGWSALHVTSYNFAKEASWHLSLSILVAAT